MRRMGRFGYAGPVAAAAAKLEATIARTISANCGIRLRCTSPALGVDHGRHRRTDRKQPGIRKTRADDLDADRQAFRPPGARYRDARHVHDGEHAVEYEVAGGVQPLWRLARGSRCDHDIAIAEQRVERLRAVGREIVG